MTQFFQLLFTGILLGGVYGLVALSIVLIYKSTKVINLAQGSILVICAFIAWTFMVPVGLPVWFSIVLAIMCGAVLGVLIERLAMRPLIGQPVLSAVIVTLTIGFFIEGVTLIAWPGVMEVFPHFIPISPVKLGELAFSQHYVWSFGIALLVFITLALFFRYT
ncbi:MAG: branched-chain amino acid ABC transporter permease, partial [Chloroflexota bacterium]|nr:branched-chain amino acid ABC transporter permease [Chloroflexota bacterium]